MSAQAVKEHSDLINLTIDGVSLSVPKGTTVYAAAQQLKIDIPIFCYQDRMPPFGACRMCLVEVEKMPKLQTSCTLVATEGMVVKTQSQIAKEGREEILEFLLINHPLDCPICDRGGECPLQDQTYKFGPERSRFYEEKRHFKKPWSLGPVLMLDRERCIACARCVRFGEHLAGDHALQFLDRGYRTEVGTPDGGPAESKFIGNTIMICPVGALTSDVYRFRARPWDNTPQATTCPLCPVGCSMFLDSRDGEIMRTRSRENKEVNDIWLCDKGWFGYEFTYHPDRLTQPLIRRADRLEPASWEEAFNLIAKQIQQAKPQGKLAALGGNPLTIEENYLFQKLMREGAGVNHLDHRVGMPIFNLEEEGLPPGMEITIGDCEQLNFILILGLDVTEEFPVIWLRLRQAINHGIPVVFLGHFAPEIDRYCSEIYLHVPGKEVEMLQQHLPLITDQIKEGKGAVFVGRQYLANSNRQAILNELIKFKAKAPHFSLNILEGRGNSQGARLAGMRPDLNPLGKTREQMGLNTLQILDTAAREGWDYLHIAGANPAAQLSSSLWRAAKARTQFLVVQDLFLTETARQADVVLPTLSFTEKEGSFMNIEGRIQSLLPGKEIPTGVYSDADIFKQIAQRLNLNLTLDLEFWDHLKTNKRFFFKQQEGSHSTSEFSSQNKPGTLKASFAYTLFDRGVRMNHDPHLIKLVKEPRVRIHSQEARKRQLQNGDYVRLIAKQQSINGKIQLDDHVAEGTLILPLGFEELRVHELEINLLNGLEIEIQKQV